MQLITITLFIIFNFLYVSVSGDCNGNTCQSCVKNTGLLYATCRWCPRDKECHEPGAIFTNPCKASENIKDVAHCPNHEVPFNPAKGYKAFSFANAAYSNCLHGCTDTDFTNYVLVDTFSFTCWGISGCFVYVTINREEKIVVVSYRGSNGVFQLIEQFIGTWVFSKNDCPFGGKIYEYFFHGLANSKSKIRTAVQPYLNEGYTLWLTGHSLGGALATVLSAYISYEKWVPNDRLFLYSFGAPRVGNFDFAQNHGLLVPNSYRIVHRKDLVSHLPPCNVPLKSEKNATDALKNRPKNEQKVLPCIGSSVPDVGTEFPYHVGIEIFYDNDMSNINSYVTCKESESSACSNKHVPILSDGINDHTNYYKKKTNHHCACKYK